MEQEIQIPNSDQFVDFPGMRGLRMARLGEADGKTLEVVEGEKDVVIPAMTHPSSEQGRVLSGAVRFMQNGTARILRKGDRWEVPEGEMQGPHVILENGTMVAIFRNGKSALDI
jgi:quercetin dioxygenase-like cupin family protein